MKDLLKIKALIWALLLGAVFAVGCEDDDPLEADRLFTPVFKDNSYGGTWIQVKWDKFKDVDAYVVSLSKDNFLTTEQEVITDTNECMFENLNYDTKYVVGIRALGDGKTSNTLTMEITTEDYPTLLAAPTPADAIDVAFRTKWTTAEDQPLYKYLELYKKSNDSLMERYELTADELEAKEKFFYGLLPETDYVVRAYDADNNYCGKKSYSTAAAEDFGENTVDLRSLEAEEAYNKLTQSFFDEVAAQFPEGATVVLSGGADYLIKEGIFFSKDITLTTGLSFAGYANLWMDNSFGIADGAKVGKLTLSKLNFTEGKSKKKTDDNYGGTYLINLNKSGGNIAELTLENCEIRYKRGMIRMQTTAEITKLTINNCIIDSIGGYGIVNNANDASYIGDIVCSNTTIGHADVMFSCGKALGINSLKLENVTTYYSPAAGKYFMDYDKNAVPGGISLLNCLLGGCKGDVKGIRSAGSSPAVDACYRASDLSITGNAIEGLVNCGLSSGELFADPDNLDFKITDKDLVNVAGDPRWW